MAVLVEARVAASLPACVATISLESSVDARTQQLDSLIASQRTAFAAAFGDDLFGDEVFVVQGYKPSSALATVESLVADEGVVGV